MDRNEILVNDKLTSILIGRRLSDSELGCAVAHRNAMIAASLSIENRIDIAWVLFAEDDANLDLEKFFYVQKDLKNLNLDVPSLVTFYSANSSFPIRRGIKRSSKSSLKRSRQWSSGTVCYAVNRRGIDEILKFSDLPIDYVADWPLYYTRLRFFISKRTKVSEVDTNSTIGDRQKIKILARIIIHSRQLLYAKRLSKLHKVSVWRVCRYLIIRTIWRDISGRYASMNSIIFLSRK
jgi:GR25 family glycosyltransferase involved in LPS biosynthesis